MWPAQLLQMRRGRGRGGVVAGMKWVMGPVHIYVCVVYLCAHVHTHTRVHVYIAVGLMSGTGLHLPWQLILPRPELGSQMTEL